MTMDTEILAEKAAMMERHLRRVQQRLPEQAADLQPMSDASDAVILHLWQAVQLVLDLALSTCVRLGLGSPGNYGEAFRKLADAGHIQADLALRLIRAAGFRNVVAHAYGQIDMSIVHRAAREGPQDLRSFFTAMRAIAVGSNG
jgi:uncharacterized protein YutE (UPF0331/DUF86 family)